MPYQRARWNRCRSCSKNTWRAAVEMVTTEALLPFIGPRILAEAQDLFRAA